MTEISIQRRSPDLAVEWMEHLMVESQNRLRALMDAATRARDSGDSPRFRRAWALVQRTLRQHARRRDTRDALISGAPL